MYFSTFNKTDPFIYYQSKDWNGVHEVSVAKLVGALKFVDQLWQQI